MIAILRSTCVRALRRAALPLACYYGVTLALPLANGAASAGSAFTGHALVVLALPLLLIVTIAAIHLAVRALLRQSGRA